MSGIDTHPQRPQAALRRRRSYVGDLTSAAPIRKAVTFANLALLTAPDALEMDHVGKGHVTFVGIDESHTVMKEDSQNGSAGGSPLHYVYINGSRSHSPAGSPRHGAASSKIDLLKVAEELAARMVKQQPAHPTHALAAHTAQPHTQMIAPPPPSYVPRALRFTPPSSMLHLRASISAHPSFDFAMVFGSAASLALLEDPEETAAESQTSQALVVCKQQP
jgi:hypothetical protein